MELKELTSRICDLFGCISIDTLPDKIMFALFSQNPTLYFEKYKELCPDLTVGGRGLFGILYINQ